MKISVVSATGASILQLDMPNSTKAETIKAIIADETARPLDSFTMRLEVSLESGPISGALESLFGVVRLLDAGSAAKKSSAPVITETPTVITSVEPAINGAGASAVSGMVL
jgi:hypothetical protein